MGQILLIGVFAAIILRDEGVTPWCMPESHGLIAAISLGSPLAIWLVSHTMIWVQGRRMDRRGDFRAVGRCDFILALSRVALVATHAFCILGLGWLDVVRAQIGDLVLADELIAALPVLLGFVGGWWSMYPIDRRIREAVILRQLDDGGPVRPMPSRTAYVLAAVRHQAALVLLPVMAIIAWNELLERGSRRFPIPSWLPLIGLQMLGMALILTLMPAILRHVWDTTRLGPGPLRDVLERMCREQRVRVRELLVWRTHGTMLNGAVMGLLGPLRYVLLTDALLEALSGPQIEAVMAHELAHIRRKHMIWLGLAGLASILLAGSLAEWVVGPESSSGQGWAAGGVVIPGLLVGLLVFGAISRRFEWQADAFAVQHLSGAHPGRPPVPISSEAVEAMSGALGLVARLNHIAADRFTFRHGSIATRRSRIQALLGRSSDRLPVDRTVRRIKILTAIAFLGAVFLAWRSGVS